MINFFKFAKQILKPIFMKLTKKDVMTKPGILHYTPQLNKALYCRYCLILAFMPLPLFDTFYPVSLHSVTQWAPYMKQE